MSNGFGVSSYTMCDCTSSAVVKLAPWDTKQQATALKRFSTAMQKRNAIDKCIRIGIVVEQKLQDSWIIVFQSQDERGDGA